MTNGYSDLILERYGPEVGKHARSSIGMALRSTPPCSARPRSGTFNGTDQVQQEVFANVPENFGESFSVQTDEFKDEGEKVVVSGRFKGQHTSGAALDASFEHVADMKDGKIARFENKPDMEAWTKGWGG